MKHGTMNFKHKSLIGFIEKSFGISRNGTLANEIYNLCLDYLCYGEVYSVPECDKNKKNAKNSTYKHFHIRLNELAGEYFHETFTPAGFRKMLRYQAHAVLDIRFYALYLAKTPKRNRTKEFAESIYSEFNICRADAARAWAYVRDRKRWTNPDFKKFTAECVSPEGLKIVRDALNTNIPQMHVNAQKMANKRLRFAARASSESIQTYASEIIADALYKLHFFMPPLVAELRKGDEDATLMRYYTTSASSSAVNLIAKSTNKKSQRIKNEGKDNKNNASYVYMETPASCILNSNGDPSDINDLMGNVEAVDETKGVILKATLDRIAEDEKKNKKTKGSVLADILFDRKDHGFVKFLLKNQLIDPKDNKSVVGIIEEIGRVKFMRNVAKFLKVKFNAVEKFLDKVKLRLTDDDGCIYA